MEVWDELFNKAVEVEDSVDFSTMTRGTGRQHYRVNVPVKSELEASSVLTVDHLIQELTRRLESNKERHSTKCLLQSKLNGINQ